MISAAGRVAPKTRKGRAVAARPLTNILNSSTTADSITAVRLQRLNALCGVTGERAATIASLLWGDPEHG